MKKYTSIFNFSKVSFVAALLVSHSALAQESSGKWSHESELGVIVSGGNTDNQTLNAKQTTKYAWTANTVTTTAAYLYGKSAGIESAKSWNAGLRYDRNLAPNWTLFAGYSAFSDTYAGFDIRNNLDLGSKYTFWKLSDNEYFLAEGGYRFTSEEAVGSNEAASIHFARIYSEVGVQLTSTATAKLWVELLPNMSDTKDFLFNFEPSVAVTLGSNLSLKLAFLGKYDGVPSVAGNKKLDYIYSTSLIAKF